MSFVLNVSNDASKKLGEFSLKDIEVLVDNEKQYWFKRADVGKFLVLRHIDTSLEGLNKCAIVTRQELIPIPRSMGGLVWA